MPEQEKSAGGAFFRSLLPVWSVFSYKMPSNEINVLIHAPAWEEQPADYNTLMQQVLEAMAQPQPGAISLVLTDDAEIQQFNRDYRGKDRPTNVLAFPSDAPDELGDILLAYRYICKEASAQGKAFTDHMTHLLVHGILHLHGYDHETDAEADEMETLEVSLLRKLGIANPYETK